MGINKYISTLLFCMWFFNPVHCQLVDTPSISNERELGLPFVQNYGPEEYRAFNQNWDAVQDSLGIMYFANGFGLLSYDGSYWNLLRLPNKSTIFGLAYGNNGKIYVGATNELGFFKTNNEGNLIYKSLIADLPQEYQDFSQIRKVCIADNNIFFVSSKYIFRWNGRNFKVWANQKDISIFYIHNTILKVFEGKGLMELKGDYFKLVSNGEILKEESVVSILPYDDKEFLIATRNKLFIFNGKTIRKFNTDFPQFFENNTIYNGILLNDGNYSFGSFKKGILILDKKGKKKMVVLDEGDRIYDLFQDNSGILWASRQSGISKIEYPSPFTYFDRRSNAPNTILNIIKYNNKEYFGSLDGLFFLNIQDDNYKMPFQSVSASFGERGVWNMILFNKNMLIGTPTALYLLNKKGESKKLFDSPVATMFRSKIDSNRVFIGSRVKEPYSGLYSIYYRNGNWVIEHQFSKVNFTVTKIIEDDRGNLWLQTNKNELVRVQFKNLNNSKNIANSSVKIFKTIDGLPETLGAPYFINNKLYFTSDKKLYKFNTKTEKFLEDKQLFSKLGLEGKKLNINYIDDNGNIWLMEYDADGNRLEQYIAYHKKNNSYELKQLNEKRIIDSKSFSIFKSFDSIVWYAEKKGLIRHDLTKTLVRNKNYNSCINKVIYQEDSTLVSGPYHTNTSTLPYDKNSFRFQYSSPSFYEEEKNEFQYQLTGFDESWSNWTLETQKDYTNIPEGNYTFKVRAKNIFGNISNEDNYRFTILPPWYRTWWAYSLYALGAFLTLVLFSQWRSKQLKAKNLALEKVVDERTQEIRTKNLQLENQTEKLKELDTMKTRLFANISHEFRTPLTLIKGPVEKMEENGEENLGMTNVKMIRRNANRLLKLVNQLLDLSKLDSGKLQLNAAEGDIFKCLRAATSSFSSHAAQRDIDYQINIPSRALWTSFDRDKLEKIIYNLLSNAFKFTPDTGKITLNVNYRNERMQITISDNGQGIKADKLPHIFDRFFQVDDSYTREKAGSGIGLALTKELVDLMEGEIYVESEFEKGSVFKVVIDMEEIKSHKKLTSEEYKIVQQDVIETTTPLVQAEKKAHQILIIEDNNDMRHFIREQLHEEYEVLEAFNGKEGLKKAKKMVPDLIITDLMMPQMDGITLCKELKVGIHTSHIPVVMLTAKAGIENKLEGLETGADDYLTKPFNARELQVRVKNLINERQKLRKLFAQKPDINPREITVTSLDEKFLNQVLELLEEKHTESEFGVPQMQDALGMSKTQLHRKLKALTDHPPGELLRNFRLKRAAQLLLQKGENVSQIAYAVGFNGLSYFTKCFKELYGVAPSDYTEKGGSNS